jgi:hypothetical protein
MIIDKCRPYLCVDGRCQSCSATSECTGALECRAGGDRFVGRYCFARGLDAPTTTGLDAVGTTTAAPGDREAAD